MRSLAIGPRTRTLATPSTQPARSILKKSLTVADPSALRSEAARGAHLAHEVAASPDAELVLATSSGSEATLGASDILLLRPGLAESDATAPAVLQRPEARSAGRTHRAELLAEALEAENLLLLNESLRVQQSGAVPDLSVLFRSKSHCTSGRRGRPPLGRPLGLAPRPSIPSGRQSADAALAMTLEPVMQVSLLETRGAAARSPRSASAASPSRALSAASARPAATPAAGAAVARSAGFSGRRLRSPGVRPRSTAMAMAAVGGADDVSETPEEQRGVGVVSHEFIAITQPVELQPKTLSPSAHAPTAKADSDSHSLLLALPDAVVPAPSPVDERRALEALSSYGADSARLSHDADAASASAFMFDANLSQSSLPPEHQSL